MIGEIEDKINQLKAKVKDVKDKIYQDEREINYILRGPKKKETDKNESKPIAEAKPEQQIEATETVEEVVESVTEPVTKNPQEVPMDEAPTVENETPVDEIKNDEEPV